MGVDGQAQTSVDQPQVNAKSDLQEPTAAADAGQINATQRAGASAVDDDAKMDLILDIPLEISIELGRTKILVNDLLKLGQGSVIELTKAAGETLEILANQKLIARGEAVVVNDKYGIRLTEVISPIERIERLK